MLQKRECGTKWLSKLEDPRLKSASAVGNVSVWGDARKDRRAATRGDAGHRELHKYHAFNRKARQLWRMSYLCRRWEASSRTEEAERVEPACTESSSQLQSASPCFFYKPIKDSHSQTTPSCIKHFPAVPSSSCLLYKRSRRVCFLWIYTFIKDLVYLYIVLDSSSNQVDKLLLTPAPALCVNNAIKVFSLVRGGIVLP